MTRFISVFLLVALAVCVHESRLNAPEAHGLLQSGMRRSHLGRAVPKILHRVLLPNGESNISNGVCSDQTKMFRENFHKSNPGWVEYVWGTDAIDKLIDASAKIFKHEHLGLEEFNHTYHARMTLWVYRADTIRWLILYHFGGLYMDADMNCNTDMSHVLDGDTVLNWPNLNNFIAGRQHHKFPLRVLGTILQSFNALEEGSPVSVVPNMTGGLRIMQTMKDVGALRPGNYYDKGITLDTVDRESLAILPRGFIQDVSRKGNHYVNPEDQKEPDTPDVCFHHSSLSWGRWRESQHAVADHPVSEKDLATSCSEVYDGTIWGEELMSIVKDLS